MLEREKEREREAAEKQCASVIGPSERVLATPASTFSLLPSRLGEHNNGPAAALEGGFYGTHSGSFGRVSVQGGQPAQLFEQLPVKDGCLCFASNLQEQQAFG